MKGEREHDRHAMEETKESDPKRKRKKQEREERQGIEKGFRRRTVAVHANRKEKEHEGRPYE